MADLAAQLVDCLLPQAPFRQYVFTFPVPLRFAMLRDTAVLSAVLQRTIRALFALLRRRAKAVGVDQPMPAALAAIQRFGGSLNVNVHFHVVVPDGVFVLDDGQHLSFVALGPPSEQDVTQLVCGVSRRVDRWIATHLTDNDDVALDDDEHQWRTQAIAEAQPPRRPSWLVGIEKPIRPPIPRCAELDGYTVHAQTAVTAEDRAGLEHLLRYCLRGPLSTERLSLSDDGRRVRYRFARPWQNGRTDIELEAVAFLRRLALIIPPPRLNLLRYHGLFAPRAIHRNKLASLLPSADRCITVVDQPDQPDSPAGAATGALVALQMSQHDDGLDPIPAPMLPPQLPPRPRLRWAELLRRVFAIDMVCSCGGSMRLIALLKDPAVVTRICHHLRWPTSAPPVDPARLPAQIDFDDYHVADQGRPPAPCSQSARGPPRPSSSPTEF